MNETRTPQEIYASQVEIAKRLLSHGFAWVEGWIYRSPSGKYHDLSAADIDQIGRIEAEDLFLVSPEQQRYYDGMTCYNMVWTSTQQS